MRRLLTPSETDQLLRYPRGRSARLARARKLPAIVLPDGEIRFDQAAIERLLEILPLDEQERMTVAARRVQRGARR